MRHIHSTSNQGDDYLGDQLNVLIQHFPFAAHVREVATNQCLAANSQYAQQQGFDHATQVIHLTHEAIMKHRYQRLSHFPECLQLEIHYQNLIKMMNHRVDHEKQRLKTPASLLLPNGFICVGTLHQIPLFTQDNTLQAVFSFYEETTPHTNLLNLYQLYKHYYPMKQAIQQFLHYLKISQYFLKLPTNQEVLILLMSRIHNAAKYIARMSGTSYRTVEEYKIRLRHKLQGITLDGLLIYLRSQYKEQSTK